MTLSLVLRLLRLLGVSLRSRTTGRSVTRSLAMLVLVRPHLHQETRYSMIQMMHNRYKQLVGAVWCKAD